MLRAADVLADLVDAARDGGSVDEARAAALIEELAAFTGGAEAAAGGDGTIEGMDFQPIAFSMDLEDAPGAADAPKRNAFSIRFKPKRELYAKANETTLLLRELGRLGEMRVTCDTAGLPPLAELDAEGAYLAWTVELADRERRGRHPRRLRIRRRRLRPRDLLGICR